MNKTTVNGHYTANGEYFTNKILALIRATELKSEVKWDYFDSIFSDFKYEKSMTAIELSEVYRIRAQQLRDSYDYLILNYSGGADSHNILHTFLKYNIKLDQIYIQWPKRLMDKGLFVPNAQDKSNANFHSEWDLVIKKDLEWLAQAHPEIKIEEFDWLDCVSEENYTDSIFEKSVSNLPSMARSIKQNNFSKIETELAAKGKRVASIFAIDKPNIIKHEDKWYFYFADTAFMAQPNPNNPIGLEYFYNTPSFPELSFIQAHKMVEWYKDHPNKEYLVQSKSDRAKSSPDIMNWHYYRHYKEWHEAAEIAKFVCYPHWDFSRFQAEKPFSVIDHPKLGVRAWDNILTALPKFARSQQAWAHHWTSYMIRIDSRLMRGRDTVPVLRSKYHRVLD